jgi:hypothetical protein
MKITVTFRPFLGSIESGYIRENKILNLNNGIPIKRDTHPRLFKYNKELYED